MKKLITYLALFFLFISINLFAQPKPDNGLSGVSILTYFEWTASGAYYLQVSTSDDFSTDFMAIDINALTSYQFTESNLDALGYSPLSNNTKYYWRIADGNLAGSGNIEPVADSYYFTTVANINITLSNPSDGADVYPFDPTQFSWYLGSSVGSIKFLLQVKASAAAPTASEWLTPDFEEDHINTTSFSLNGLTGGTKYFWRVIAYYDDGSNSSSYDVDDRVVKISSAYEFNTQGGAVKAYPSWPVGGNIIYNLLPTYYWYTMQYDANATFEVYVVEDGSNVGDLSKLDDDGSTPISAGSDTYVEEDADLDPSTTYLWQVKTTNGSAINYSDIAEFTTYDAPGATATKPTLSYPVGGLTIYTTSPTLYWYIGAINSGAFYFEVEFSTNSGTTWSTYPTTTTNTYLQVSGLTPGVDYTWRVTHTDGSSSETSDEGTFSIAGGIGSTVVLNWPIGDPLLYTTTPTISWYVEGSTLGWDNFIVKWNKNSAPADWAGATTGSYTTTDINETWYEIPASLDHGSTYYWAVALESGTYTPVHADYESSSFTIAGGSASVELTHPSDETVVNTLKPTFFWWVSGSALGIDKYKVTYSNTELFTANVVELISLTTNAPVVVDLQEGATYWWYVSVSYDGGSTYSVASPTWSFTVDPGANAVMPLVGSPKNDVTTGDNAPVLSWYLPAQSESTLSYEVELADNPGFSNSQSYTGLTEANVQADELSDGHYYWRVKSSTGNSESSYSNIGSFNIGSVTDVDEENELVLTYELDQNYPNPFNPTTLINYSIPENSFVTIKIYDMLGREVRTLLSKEIKAGQHKVQWNGYNNYGNKVTSGTYIYKITANDFSKAKKMLLIK